MYQSVYIIGVTKQNLVKDLFRTVYILLSKHVNPVAPSKFWYPAFPYKDIEEGSLDYPIGVIESPSLKWDKFTIMKKLVTGTFTFDIFSTKSSEADDLFQQTMFAIDNERKTLWNLNVKKVNLSTTLNEHFLRDKVKVHLREMQFTFQYPITQGIFEQ